MAERPVVLAAARRKSRRNFRLDRCVWPYALRVVESFVELRRRIQSEVAGTGRVLWPNAHNQSWRRRESSRYFGLSRESVYKQRFVGRNGRVPDARNVVMGGRADGG